MELEVHLARPPARQVLDESDLPTARASGEDVHPLRGVAKLPESLDGPPVRRSLPVAGRSPTLRG